jgi:hypothetical protein
MRWIVSPSESNAAAEIVKRNYGCDQIQSKFMF